MKKSYMKLRAMIAVCSVLTFGAIAQPLNGVYTINSANTTSYPSGTNFQTFGALATALNTNGVSGPVTINVAPGSGPYVEQVTFNAITGVSATKKITIEGNGCILTYNSSSSTQPWTLGLNGTDFLNVNNLKIEGTGTTYALVVILSNAADYNSFTKCSMTCPVNGTSSYQVPYSISSAMNVPTGGTNSGNYNSVTTCTLSNGYYGYFHYGLTGAPYQVGNSIKGSVITDFYYYGMYYPYSKEFYVGFNTIERPTRTSTSAVFMMYGYYSQGLMCEGNLMWKFVEATPGVAATLYGIYNYGHPIANGLRNTYRNNIMTGFKNNTTIYGFYIYSSGSDVYNNTLDFDYSAATTAITVYGMYCYGSVGYEMNIHSNIVTIRRGGSASSWYPLYIAVTGNINVDYNNLISLGTSGTNYIGYYNGAHLNTTTWKAQGMDLNGNSLDPIYTTPYLDLHPTNVNLNNKGQPNGLVFDQQSMVRNQTTPDVGALEFMTPACTGAPASNTVTTPNYPICPGEDVSMGLANLNSLAQSGLTYQWSTSSISNVGPFTPISGATGLFYTAPSVTANTYYSVVMTCTAPGGSSVQAVGQVIVAGPTASTVPAYEGFELVGKPDRMPNCSWSATGAGSQNRTSPTSNSGNRVPHTGTSFGYFSNASPGTSYFFTNKIAMKTGITYSAAVWYATEYFGYNNWANLTIMVGPNQSTVGMSPIAVVNPAITGPYKLLNGTFTVNTTGDYYVAIKATGNAGNAQYLMIDDLSITIPCQAGSPNLSNVSFDASDSLICAGEIISLNAVGADSYTFNTGDVNTTGNVSPLTPMTSTVYTVMGENSLTGCITTEMVNVTVMTPPNVFVVANNPAVCPNQPVILTVFGAANVVWNPTNSNAINLTVNPAATTAYTVTGTDANGCSTDFVQTVTVHPLPNVTANTSNPDACKDDMLMLTAIGNGASYQWFSSVSPVVYQGNPITVQALASTVFTVVATSSNNCQGSATISQNISDCVGLAKNSSNISGVSIYPNPTSGVFSVVLHSDADKTVNVTDVTGRVILTSTSNEEVIDLNISNLSAGVYYVSVQSENSTKVVKIVKN